MRYRRKPSEVEAAQWTGDNIEEMQAVADGSFYDVPPDDRGDDPEGTGQFCDSSWKLMYDGDYLVKEHGRLSRYRPEEFARDFEPAGE